MRKRSQPAVFVLLGICFVVFAVRVSQPPEPVYDGKTVGQWVAESKVAVGVVRMPGTTLVFPAGMSDEALAGMPALVGTNETAKILGGSSGISSLSFFEFLDGVGLLTADAYSAVQKDAATQALEAMGAEAMPYLRGQLNRKNPSLTVWHFSVWSKLPIPARRFLPPPRSAAVQRAKAAHALGRLGPAAKDAVPELSRLVGNDDYPIVRAVALESVKRIARQ